MRRAAALILTAVACSAGVQLALAAWASAGTGGGAGKAQQLPAGPQPTLSVSGSQVTVTWTQVSLGGSRVGALPGGGYTVTRYANGSSVPITPGAGCSATRSGSTAQLSCTESSVPDGTWQYTVTPVLRNWQGSASTKSTGAVVDVNAPTTTASLSPAPNAAGWDTANVTVTLTATDTAGGSGVNTITYSATGAQAISTTNISASTTGVSITTAGTTTISFYATDNNGNVEATKTQVVKLDKTAPTAAAAVVVNGDTGVTGYVRPGGTYRVYANASDATSGLSTVTTDVSSITSGTTAATLSACASSCTIGGTTYGFVSSTLTASGGLTSGAKSWSVTATDAAGLASTLSGLSATADTTAPAVTLTAPAGNSWTNNQKPTTSGAAGTATGDLTTITVKIYSGLTPTGSPVQTLTTTATAGTWSVAPASNLAQGIYTAQASQTDSAGNTATSNADTFTIDTTPPVVTVDNTCTTTGHGANQNASVSGTTGTQSGDAGTITLVIYNGSGTGGTVFQTQTITPSGGIWTASSNTLTVHSTYTVQATQTDAAGNTGTSGTCTFSS